MASAEAPRACRIAGVPIAVAPIGLGGWLTLGGALDERASLALLHAAVEGGIGLLDLADVYADGGAERVVGTFLRTADRSRLVLTSKVFWPTSQRAEDRGLSRRHIHASIDRTLQRLGVDGLDVYFCHRDDPATPLAETVQAMGDLVRVGKIRSWGTSCWRPDRLRQAVALAAQLGVAPPAVEQPPYNLLERSIEGDVLPACRRLGLAVLVWSPLAGGVLTGKYLDGTPAGSRGAVSGWVDGYRTAPAGHAVRRFVAACRERGLPPAAVALAWAASQPGVSAALVGASSPAQLQQNLIALRLLADGVDLAWAGRCAPAGWRVRLRSLLQRFQAGMRRENRY